MLKIVVALDEGLFEVVNKHVIQSLLILPVLLLVIEEFAILVLGWAVLAAKFSQFDDLLSCVNYLLLHHFEETEAVGLFL